jgi:hypothetical protein
MSGFEIAAILGAIASLIAALTSSFAIIMAIMNRTKLTIIGDKVEQVHIATNSLQDKLVQATAAASRAEGFEAARKGLT